MQTVHYENLPPLDEYGLLLKAELWNKVVAQEMAYSLGLGQLGREHWRVIHRLRDYYDEYGVAPAMNHICYEEHKDGLWIHNLFESCLNAWRVAGLPDPGEEAKAYLSDM